MNKLTAKEKRFCDEYLLCLNATQAAIKAGYSKKTAKERGYQLIHKTSLSKYINERQQFTSNKLQITTETLLLELNEAKKMASILNVNTGQPNTSAYISAIEAQAKMLGLNAPNKHELTGKGGKDLQAPSINIYNNAPPIANSENDVDD